MAGGKIGPAGAADILHPLLENRTWYGEDRAASGRGGRGWGRGEERGGLARLAAGRQSSRAGGRQAAGTVGGWGDASAQPATDGGSRRRLAARENWEGKGGWGREQAIFQPRIGRAGKGVSLRLREEERKQKGEKGRTGEGRREKVEGLKDCWL